MERTKKVNITINAGIGIDEREISVSIPMGVLRILFKEMEDNGSSDVDTLFLFYYYTARWQSTDQAWANNYYVMNGLHWTEPRLLRAKKRLIELKLISIVRNQNINGTFQKSYIRLHLDARPSGTAATGFGEGPVYNGVNALNPSYINALNPNNKNILSSKHFEQFWKAYPKHAGKGAAMSAFNKLCKKKDSPSIDKILIAIVRQQDSQQWQNPMYIPHAATWLNQSRWLDDPKEMVSYSTVRDSKGRSKPAKILEYGKWWEWSERDECYFSATGEQLIR